MDKATDLKERYGKRIQEIMMVPVIEDIYRKIRNLSDIRGAEAAPVQAQNDQQVAQSTIEDITRRLQEVENSQWKRRKRKYGRLRKLKQPTERHPWCLVVARTSLDLDSTLFETHPITQARVVPILLLYLNYSIDDISVDKTKIACIIRKRRSRQCA